MEKLLNILKLVGMELLAFPRYVYKRTIGEMLRPMTKAESAAFFARLKAEREAEESKKAKKKSLFDNGHEYHPVTSTDSDYYMYNDD